MAELELEEEPVRGSIKDTGLAMARTEVAPHPMHQVPGYFFRMWLAPSGSEAGRINLRVGPTLQFGLSSRWTISRR